MIFRLIILLLLIPSYSCASVENGDVKTHSKIDQNNYLDRLKVNLNHKDITYVHVVAKDDLVEGQQVNRGDKLGTIQDSPDKFSERYNSEYLESIKLYKADDYLRAAEILNNAIHEESDNPFMLNQYARSLFWIPSFKKDSFEAYSKLINILDNQTTRKDCVVIDLWFIEAYWKIASLHLDRGEYQKALFNISRFLIGYAMTRVPSDELYEQAFEYLAESYYYLGDFKNAKHFAELVLGINSQNMMARKYVVNRQSNHYKASDSQ